VQNGHLARQFKREYDPVKLGFAVDTACEPKDCVVDTRRIGDGNGGHLYGTGLTEPERMAVLEYLKIY
jgi:hypothetical protein